MLPSAKYPHLQQRHSSGKAVVYLWTAKNHINMKTTTEPRGHVAYAMFKTDGTRDRVTRIVTTQQAFEDWRLGTVVGLYSASDSKDLGRYMVVGVRDIDSDEQAGDVPDRLVIHSPTT